MWDQETGEIGETVGGLESVLQLIISEEMVVVPLKAKLQKGFQERLLVP